VGGESRITIISHGTTKKYTGQNSHDIELNLANDREGISLQTTHSYCKDSLVQRTLAIIA